MLEKRISYDHSITENGNIQVRQVTEYLKDGKVTDKKYSNPYTPKDVQNMAGFDDRSKEIVAVIIDPKIKAEFAIETEANRTQDGDIVEIISHDRVIDEDGKIAVRRITRIFDEGKEVSKKYHRSWIMSGDDPKNNDVISKALAKKLHTPKVVAAYKTTLAEVVKI